MLDSCLAGLPWDGRGLATVPPGDEESEEDVESAEACGQEPVAPGRGAEDSESAEKHEAKAHHWDDLDGEGASGNNAGTVEQEPSGGQGRLQARAEQEECQKGSGNQGRSEAEGDFARRAGKQGQAAAVCFPVAGQQSDSDSEKAFCEPD